MKQANFLASARASRVVIQNIEDEGTSSIAHIEDAETRAVKSFLKKFGLKIQRAKDNPYCFDIFTADSQYLGNLFEKSSVTCRALVRFERI